MATTRNATARTVAVGVAGMALGAGLALVATGLGDAPPASTDPVELMCGALGAIDPSFLEQLEDDDIGVGTAEAEGVHLLLAASDLADAAAAQGDHADLRDASQGLREALTRVQGELAVEHVAELRQAC